MMGLLNNSRTLLTLNVRAGTPPASSAGRLMGYEPFERYDYDELLTLARIVARGRRDLRRHSAAVR
jgi:hypothetical protein